jgi:hypothetical protein
MAAGYSGGSAHRLPMWLADVSAGIYDHISSESGTSSPLNSNVSPEEQLIAILNH